MKKVITLLLALCMIFTLAACGGTDKPADTKPTATQPTEPEVKEYVLLKAKADIMMGQQMTPENMEAWFESYTTTNEEEAKNAIRWDKRKSIEYLWTKEAIAGNTIVHAGMFTTTVPEGAVPKDPTEDLTYDDAYVGLINKDGLSMNVAAADLLAKLPEGTTGRNINVTGISIFVFDRAEGNANEYREQLAGEYNLKQHTGMLTFATQNQDMNLGALESILGNTSNVMSAITYSTYMQKQFADPVVQITCTINVDGKDYPVAVGGTFTMAIDPASGLDAQELLQIAETLLSGSTDSGLGSWLEGLLGGAGGIFGGN